MTTVELPSLNQRIVPYVCPVCGLRYDDRITFSKDSKGVNPPNEKPIECTCDHCSKERMERLLSRKRAFA